MRAIVTTSHGRRHGNRRSEADSPILIFGSESAIRFSPPDEKNQPVPVPTNTSSKPSPSKSATPRSAVGSGI